MTPFELGMLIMGVSGWALVTYLIYKSRMDKAKLEFEEESKTFYPAEGNNYFSTILIRFKAHNKGTKSTTIYHSKLTFNYNSEQKETVDEKSSFEVPPNSTVDFYPNLNIHSSEFVLHGKITNCVVTVKHTFGKKVRNLGTIEQLKKTD